jgi:glycosyltransferase involved in cell wall biosynthesis
VVAHLSDTCDVSVVVPTRNRAPLLRAALTSLLAQRAGSVRYEVLVVDNGSTDDTKAIVTELSDTGRLRYFFEPRKGPSYARNRGVEESLAPIVAFADDDVQVSESWVVQVHSSMNRHSDVDCVGGRVLPEWPREPPHWATTKSHWGPLALADYGPHPIRINLAHPLCLLTANMAVRRSAITAVGGFDPRYLRCQDHELQIRLWQAGFQCLYDPSLVVTSPVDVERLTKAYVRRWYRKSAYYQAKMPARALFDLPGDGHMILNVPRFLYRSLAEEVARWTLHLVRRDATDAFLHETRVHHLTTYVLERWKLWATRRFVGERQTAATQSSAALP